jgi:hypothetical protein
MDTIELRGLTFRVDIRPDDSIGAPWAEHDGHGPVRSERYTPGSTHRNVKRPGERVLYTDRGYSWLYDWQGAMELAKKDGWGIGPDQLAALTSKLGRAPTPGEIRVAAVQRDFDYCRGYLAGDWQWCGVIVTLLDVDIKPVQENSVTQCFESLWGMESSDYRHIDETARELASEIAKRVGRRKYIETRVRVRA